MYSSSYPMARSKKKIEEESLEKEKPFVYFPRNFRKRVAEEVKISEEPYVENQNTIEKENPEELPIDEAQKKHHDLIEELEKQA